MVKVQIAENHAAGTNKKQILVVLRFEVSQVPKSEAPGAPSIEVNADHLFHVPWVGNAGGGLKPILFR